MTQMTTNSLAGLLKEYKVIIPPIQRDYAQGRNTGKIPHIRERFLADLLNVLVDDKLSTLELDFVYGYIEKDSLENQDVLRFKPLDGQQRLTTLFLIHWYVASREPISVDKKSILKKFSYSTRESSRHFCEELTNFENFKPTFAYESIDKEIIDQPWFFTAWKSDPTIESMLVVLQAIEEKFIALNIEWEKSDFWNKLTVANPRIIFHLLPMADLGLPDDLYIKMNARGKGLTDFEHFKSQFSEVLNPERAKEFNEKIDKAWSDLFWNIFKNKNDIDLAKKVDNGFLGFFWYITDLLINKNNIEIKSSFWLDKIKEVYFNSDENVSFLFESLDLFEKLEKENKSYFDDIYYIDSKDFEIGKTKIFFNNIDVNLFRKCADSYGFDGKKNNFTVGEQLLLYAFIYSNRNDRNIDNLKYRQLRNIFAASELKNEYLSKFLYSDVELIIDKSQFSENSKLSKRQLEEEKFKEQLISNNPDLRGSIYQLEDHTLLRGNISVLALDSTISLYANQFEKIFMSNVNYFEISRAMLTIGDYSQTYSNLLRFGNKHESTWRELFTQSESRKGFDKTQEVLKKYLDLLIANPSITNSDLVNAYLKQCTSCVNAPKDWRYYYIKYQSFIMWDNYQTEGFYRWDHFASKPYECIMMLKQYGGRHWSPFLLELSKMNRCLSLGIYGNDLQYTNGDIILLIKNRNTGFEFYANDDNSKDYINELIVNGKLNSESILTIQQNENGIDIEDRIIKCNEFLNSLDLQ